jgi:hypothetical protein
LAWVPVRLAPRFERLWNQLGIDNVVTHDRMPEVVIIDLPDIDSVESRHREMVNGLMSDLDRVLWVVDPEKYRDRVLHEHHLRPRAAAGSKFRFVLNQIDRLSEAELEAVASDLASVLAGDGFVDAQLSLVAADPTVGPPVGTEELWEEITIDLRTPDDGAQRARTELGRGIKMLEPLVTPVEFGPRWDAVRMAAADRWAQSGVEGLRMLTSFVQDLSFETPEIPSDLDVASLVGVAPDATVARHLDATLGRWLRDRLRPRAATRAVLTELTMVLQPTVPSAVE